MTLVDSADSILMLYSYAGFPERSLKLFERIPEPESEKSSLIESEHPASESRNSLSVQSPVDVDLDSKKGPLPGEGVQTSVIEDVAELPSHSHVGPSGLETHTSSPLVIPETAKSQEVKRNLLIKENTMSGLSIVLTLISILVAFR